MKDNTNKQEVLKTLKAITKEQEHINDEVYSLQRKKENLYNNKKEIVLQFVRKNAKFNIGDFFSYHTKGIYIKDIVIKRYDEFNGQHEQEITPFYVLCYLSAKGKKLLTKYTTISEENMLWNINERNFIKIDKDTEDIYFIPSFILFNTITIKEIKDRKMTIFGSTAKGRSYLFTLKDNYKPVIDKVITCTDESIKLFLRKQNGRTTYSLGRRKSVPKTVNKSGHSDDKICTVYDIKLFKNVVELLEHVI